MEWSESDGKEETFAASNARFRRNGCKVASAAFGWWRLRTPLAKLLRNAHFIREIFYKVILDAVKFARIRRNRHLRVVRPVGAPNRAQASAERFGWSAWLAPSETRKGGEA